MVQSWLPATTLAAFSTISRGPLRLRMYYRRRSIRISSAQHLRTPWGTYRLLGSTCDAARICELMLAPLHSLCKAGHAVSAVLIGGGPDGRVTASDPRARLRRPRRIHHVPIETLRDKLRSLDLFVVPSHQEGLCISALEAMACGCPVVSTHCGGPEEFVLDGETGFLVNPDPAEMADATRRILGAPKLGGDGRRRAGEGGCGIIRLQGRVRSSGALSTSSLHTGTRGRLIG